MRGLAVRLAIRKFPDLLPGRPTVGWSTKNLRPIFPITYIRDVIEFTTLAEVKRCCKHSHIQETVLARRRVC